MKKHTDLLPFIKKIKFWFVAILLLIHICVPGKMLQAQPKAEVQTVQRIPTEKDLEKYRQDPAFNYEVSPQPESLWEKFMRYLRKVFGVKQDSFADEFLSQYIWYILFIILLGFLIYTIFKSDIKGLFYKSFASNIKMQSLEEDINIIDFNKLISDAVSSSNFRYAIRLYYLKNLKELNDNGLIDWKLNKTNQDYMKELSGKSIYGSFSGITHLFNWIWYGDFPLSENDFTEIKSEFIQFSDQLKAGK